MAIRRIKESRLRYKQEDYRMLNEFYKQKTAYEIVSRDWSSDVCSSDLHGLYTSDSQPPSIARVPIRRDKRGCLMHLSLIHIYSPRYGYNRRSRHHSPSANDRNQCEAKDRKSVV